MKKFIRDNKLPFEVVYDLSVIGIKTRRLSKAFSKKQREEAVKSGKKPQHAKGRPGEYAYDCTFCGKKKGPAGELI